MFIIADEVFNDSELKMIVEIIRCVYIMSYTIFCGDNKKGRANVTLPLIITCISVALKIAITH